MREKYGVTTPFTATPYPVRGLLRNGHTVGQRYGRGLRGRLRQSFDRDQHADATDGANGPQREVPERAELRSVEGCEGREPASDHPEVGPPHHGGGSGAAAAP